MADEDPAAIDTGQIVPMDLFEDTEPLAIDLVYADAGHPENIFACAAYHPAARLSLHADLARIVLLAARRLRERHGWTLVLKDGLRVVEAQQRLVETPIVAANPHWLSPPRLLSGPGQGAHPRAMAVDLAPRGADGCAIDMGTRFDEMVGASARSYRDFPAGILAARDALERATTESAARLSVPLLPLASEWWDFRLPPDVTGRFAPLRDADLPPALRMIAPGNADAGDAARLAGLAKSISASL